MNEQVKNIMTRLKNLVHEGNIRRIIVTHNGETIVNVPLTAGVFSSWLLPCFSGFQVFGSIVERV